MLADAKKAKKELRQHDLDAKSLRAEAAGLQQENGILRGDLAAMTVLEKEQRERLADQKQRGYALQIAENRARSDVLGVKKVFNLDPEADF